MLERSSIDTYLRDSSDIIQYRDIPLTLISSHPGLIFFDLMYLGFQIFLSNLNCNFNVMFL